MSEEAVIEPVDAALAVLEELKGSEWRACAISTWRTPPYSHW